MTVAELIGRLQEMDQGMTVWLCSVNPEHPEEFGRLEPVDLWVNRFKRRLEIG